MNVQGESRLYLELIYVYILLFELSGYGGRSLQVLALEVLSFTLSSTKAFGIWHLNPEHAV